MEKRYFDSLVSIRGFLIIGIVICHVGNTFDLPLSSLLAFIYNNGGIFGNYIFFMLSGFLISNSYKWRIRKDGMSLAEYMRRRLIKLYPLYFITVIICFVISIYRSGWETTSLKRIILTILMMSSGWVEDIYPYNISCWFVSMLILCYLVYWIVCALSKNNGSMYFLLLFALTITGHIFLKYRFNVPFAYAHTGEGFCNFFMGCIVYEIYISLNEQFKKAAGFSGGAILVLLVLASYKLGFSFVMGDIYFVLPVLIAPCVILSLIEIKILSKIMNFPLFKWLGRISMSIYYWHIPLIALLEFSSFYASINHQIRFLLYMTLLLIWSSISYLVIESFLDGTKLKYPKNCKTLQ